MKFASKEDTMTGNRSLPTCNIDRARTRAETRQNVHNISTNNSFQILQDHEEEITTDSHLVPKRKRTNSMTNQPNPKKPDIPRREKKPNVILASISNEEVQRMISSPSLKGKNITYKKAGRTVNSFQIQASNVEDKKILIEMLTSKNYQHHTFTEASDRQLQYILTNHITSDPKIVHDQLKREKIPASKVIKIGKSIKNPVFLVQFEKGSITYHDLCNNHQYLERLKIQWLKQDPTTKKPTQCKRCQLWGHSASGCNRQFRCVKCIIPHGPGECLRKPHQDEKPSCVNCKEEGHTSNSTTCKFYKNYMKKISRQKRENTNLNDKNHQEISSNSQVRYINNFPNLSNNSSRPSAASTSNHVNENSNNFPSYASHFYKTNIQANPRANDSFSQFVQIREELNNIPDMLETIACFKSLVDQLKAANSHKERAMVLFNFSTQSSWV